MSEVTQTFRSPMPVSAGEVFDWHARPGAFERLTPPWAPVRVLESEGTVFPGDWKKLWLGAGPVGITWTLVHGVADIPTGFIDEQLAGPFQSWRHTHRFAPNGAKAANIEDEVTYRLPLGAVGQGAVGGIVAHELDRLFQFRHRRTWDDLERHATFTNAPLRVVVSGASGLIGRQLVAFLRTGGHEVLRLVRKPNAGADEISWDPARGTIDAAALEGVDAAIHLGGVSIAGGLWTEARKQAIKQSRVEGTALLARTLASLANPPSVFVSASAIGFYGNAGDARLTERSPAGGDFLSEVCQAWEAATDPAAEAGIRVVTPRFGLVLSGGGGLLKQVLPVFQLGLGGPLGNGNQYMSWIALDDLLGVLLAAVANERLSGPVNAVAPRPVTNREFTATLARVLHRPAVIPVPEAMLRLLPGGMGEEIFLASQRVEPKKLQDIAFRFAFPTLEDALRHELGRLDAVRDRTPAIELTKAFATS